ncbi:hypothetical protein MBLNU459_g2816t1 [Dothideomycetes sp. NU459]
MLNGINGFFDRLGRSKYMSARNFQYACAASGIFTALTFLLGFVAAGFLPPVKPYGDAESILKHYVDHNTGIKAGSALLLISGGAYIPLTAAISAQMRRIPNLHYSVIAVQLAGGAAGIFSFMMPGMFLGVANFRLDRPVEITQALNDMFWIMALMPWPTFMVQNFAFAYAIIIDNRPKPLFPKSIAIMSIVAPIVFATATGVHTVKTGPFAWNGGFTFWAVGSVFIVQLVVESLCLMRAVYSEDIEGERIDDGLTASHEGSDKDAYSPKV